MKLFKFTCLLIVLAYAPLLKAQQLVIGTLLFDGIERDYRLYLPANFDRANKPALVFNLHGFGSNALEQQAYSRMNLVADTANLVLCYPNGHNNAWNVGWSFGSFEDDVRFIDTLIDIFISEYNVNPGKVYSCGMSNGGFMSYRLACELNDKIAAVASVTGSIAPGYIDQCNPGRAVPVMEIHGTNDDVVDYDGSFGISISIDEVIEFWTNNNGCVGEPTETLFPNESLIDFSSATRFDYTNCEEDTEVVLIRIANGGHTWPGATISLGVTNQDFEASPTIWDFFNRFSLDNSVAANDIPVNDPSIKVFPNPATESLQVDGLTGLGEYSFEIYNPLGQLVKNGLYLSSNRINIKELEDGLYYLVLGSAATKNIITFIKH